MRVVHALLVHVVDEDHHPLAVAVGGPAAIDASSEVAGLLVHRLEVVAHGVQVGQVEEEVAAELGGQAGGEEDDVVGESGGAVAAAEHDRGVAEVVEAGAVKDLQDTVIVRSRGVVRPREYPPGV